MSLREPTPGAHPDAAIGIALAEIAEIPPGAHPLGETAKRRTERSVSSCKWISASVLLSHFRGASHSLIDVSLAETAETLAPIPRHWCPKIPGADVASPPFPHASSARIILQARLMHRLALAEYN